MHKHLQVLPAVIAIFQHFEWNDPNWLEKQKYCATLVQTIRTGLQVDKEGKSSPFFDNEIISTIIETGYTYLLGTITKITANATGRGSNWFGEGE